MTTRIRFKIPAIGEKPQAQVKREREPKLHFTLTNSLKEQSAVLANLRRRLHAQDCLLRNIKFRKASPKTIARAEKVRAELHAELFKGEIEYHKNKSDERRKHLNQQRALRTARKLHELEWNNS